MSSKILNAVITSTMLGYEDHGIFTCMIRLDHEHGSQGFGGYCMDGPNKSPTAINKHFKRLGTEFGMQYLIQVLNALEVDTWENLKGVHCRVDCEHGKIHGIGHFIKNKWFSPEADLKSLAS